MRVMLDTNVLVSMVLFPSQRFRRMLETITTRHTLVLSSFVIDELMDVARRKFPDRVDAMDRFLSKLGYEMVYTPQVITEKLFEIRDDNDYPVLYTAVIEDVDILITGDKDFGAVDIEKPEIMTPAQFIEKYC